MQQIVECVPNFSNGRLPELYNTIADAIHSVPGVRILDVSANFDHNRTVITFVGSLEDVEEGAFRAIAKAAQLINLDEHQGDHPRLGATDVCPFVPIKGVSLQECIDMAHRLGERVGRELGIAVYFYSHAAKSPDRLDLMAIRQGQYEQWKQEIGNNPTRQPDCGPAIPQPWGATVIGVRPFLIAYNLHLNSSQLEHAQNIAKAVRYSNGGLRNVQAKGFVINDQAQVSMNLLNFEQTPLHRVQELVRQEAQRYGLSITKAELVGMIPQKALIESAKWYLQLDQMRDDQVLESRLYDDENGIDMLPTNFIQAVGSSRPTPGGGSVSALAGALGAALTQMVAGLTVGRKKYAAVDEEARAIRADAQDLRAKLTKAVLDDSAAYNRLMFTRRNSYMDETVRHNAIATATMAVAQIPLEVARLSYQVVLLARDIVEIGNLNAATDAAVGALMAQTAVLASALNVRINAKAIADKTIVTRWENELIRLENETKATVTVVIATARQRGGF